MRVILPVIRESAPGSRKFLVAQRVEVPAELLEAPDGAYYCVRLQTAGAGLAAGAEITVPASQVVLD